MKGFLRWFRAIVITLIMLAVGIPATLFICLSIPAVQQKIVDRAAAELSEVLDSEVKIEHMSIAPFNRITLYDVSLTDRFNRPAAKVRQLGAGISLIDLIFFGEWVVNYVEIIGLDGLISRAEPGAPLNISNIIEAVTPKEEKKEKTRFRLSINSIILRGVNFSYDVESVPLPPPGRFNRNHIGIKNLRADISVPILSNDTYAADIHRLALEEQAGFSITDLRGRLFLSTDSVTVSGFSINLPNSLLSFSDLILKFPAHSDLRHILGSNTVEFSINGDSYLTPCDFACFFQPLANFRNPLDLTLKLKGDAQKFSLSPLRLTSADHSLSVFIEGDAFNILDNDDRMVDFSRISVLSDGHQLSTLLSGNIGPKARNIITNIGIFSFNGDTRLTEKELDLSGTLEAESGNIALEMTAHYDVTKASIFPLDYSLDAQLHRIELGQLLDDARFGTLNLALNSEGKVDIRKALTSTTEVDIDNLEWNGYEYTGIGLNLNTNHNELEALLQSQNDSNLIFVADVTYGFSSKEPKTLSFQLDADSFNPFQLGLTDKWPGKSFALSAGGEMHWDNAADVIGHIDMADFTVTDSTAVNSILQYLTFTASGTPDNRFIEAKSDLFNFTLEGAFNPTTFIPEVKDAVASLAPALITPVTEGPSTDNNFKFDCSIAQTESLRELLPLPVSALAPVDIEGTFNSADNNLLVEVTAPYLRQGNKLIENTALSLSMLYGQAGVLSLSTDMPTKDGMMTVEVNNTMQNDTLQTLAGWKIDRQRAFRGDISLTTVFTGHLDDNARRLDTEVKLNQSSLEFNDSLWHIDPSIIEITGKESIVINGLTAHRQGQSVKIDGTVSANPDVMVTVELDNINLDYIFETLAINHVNIGGDATGTVVGSQLLSANPIIYTKNLDIKALSYNKTVLGDALVKSDFNKAGVGLDLDVDIEQPDDRHSSLKGEVLIAKEELDLNFNTDRIRIGFLQPYMGAFASQVSGYASGNARLFGTFHDIDLTGRLLADSVSLKVDFINATYLASDSVIIDPGRINFNNLKITDVYGHEARLNGHLNHAFFRRPTFEFNITDARNLLVLDESEAMNPRWWGKVFANGEASVKGGPGFVDISCAMSTAEGTTFDFALTDMQDAGEYTFITFRDRDSINIEREIVYDPTPVLVREFKSRQQKIVEESHSRYDLDFNIDITPDARIDLIMDPVAGDRIRAYGNGNMRINYASTDEDLKIYGKYTLERGNYNFSLQQIIIKDFTIRDGSSITFHGDPYTAILDITAIYSLTANLSDLDSQFLEDKDISRTNVPVHALLHVAGDLHQPDISFDLEFPTLTQDTYRKVRSIVSTEDMMNRQIIYLLALNRFYTPDYMDSATKGNELISVASSTLSSQLSNILGQISDKWSIAPSIRSERADFADMEVDLALSSSLLNNRLLLNGNFGYRDKLMNNNQFIGDFDIEYLLNRKGSIRLKAYNRYNDRNFYFKTAATTQGVGVVFKHDFDSFLSFLRMFRKEDEKN